MGYMAVGRIRCLARRALKVEKCPASWSYMWFIRGRRWGWRWRRGGVWAAYIRVAASSPAWFTRRAEERNWRCSGEREVRLRCLGGLEEPWGPEDVQAYRVVWLRIRLGARKSQRSGGRVVICVRGRDEMARRQTGAIVILGDLDGIANMRYDNCSKITKSQGTQDTVYAQIAQASWSNCRRQDPRMGQ